MAKNQDLTLNFSKLNGVCGQLKCCLQYEDEVYREKRSRLPKEGDYITTHTGEMGRVDRLHLLSEQFVMMTNRGVRKRYVVDLYKETLDKETANFPKEFESVSDETHKVVGLDAAEAQKIHIFEDEVKTYQAKSKNFADTIFQSLFGDKTLDYSLPEVEELESSRSKVKIPDEEEEILYTPSEDEMLPDDEDDDILDHEPVRTRVDNLDRNDRRPSGPRDNSNQGRQWVGQKGQRNQNNRSQGPRTQGVSQDNRQRNDNRNQNRPSQSIRPEGGPNPQGGGQGRNQGRSRPPR
jgi:hypothetical protein